MTQAVATHELKIKQMRRFRVEPRIADERRLRPALLHSQPEPEGPQPLSSGIRTLCSATALACGIVLNTSTLALGGQVTWDAIRAIAPIL